LAHDFEAQLRDVQTSERDNPGSAGAAILALPLRLEDLQTKLSTVQALAEAQNRQSSQLDDAQKPTLAKPAQEEAMFGQLAQQIANDLGKQVALHVDMASWPKLSDAQKTVVHEVAVQLIRNAVVHGIGAPASRHAALKPAQGHVDVALLDSGGTATLVVRDDGTGLVQTRLRNRLVELGWYSAASVATLTDNQVFQCMFKPGFSTESAHGAQGIHAGRGVGLDLVQDRAKAIGGRIGMSTQAGRYTEFRLSFPLADASAHGGPA
jgi:two-component system, chemotaxis family, sensor kinase CheA